MLVPNVRTISSGSLESLKRVQSSLGDNLVLVRITGTVGVGCNFIKFGVENLGSSFRNKIPVKRMIVSFSPRRFPPFLLSTLQMFLPSLVLEINEGFC